jgi:GalNAc-alpha-(1->4)-GalNAc-alpha-(1->3)-diNAcBac-PP-undecaprenol alpha-1,4-N-acetyl-D-galactosaminyltransferase
MKILFACRNFVDMAGGVERMAIAAMNELCRRGHHVSLLTWDPAGGEAFYAMDERIEWRRLDLGDPKHRAGLGLRLRRALRVRRLLAELAPDVAIAFQEGTFRALRVYGLGLRLPMIAAERNSPSRFDFVTQGSRGRSMQWLRLADRITVQCESYRELYPSFLRRKIVAIPNPVFPASGRAAPAGDENAPQVLLSVGRLSFQKNQVALVQAFARLAPRFPRWRMDIAGEGEHRAEVEAEIARLGLGERVRLLGAVKDVSALYRASHLFCLASRWEGFPNALAEALAHGLPAVSYADCCGINELIQPDRNGLLAAGNGDAETLADTLGRLMADSASRQAMGAAAAESMRAYTPQAVFDRWETVLAEVAQRRLVPA